jgi:hypothetical protein
MRSQTEKDSQVHMNVRIKSDYEAQGEQDGQPGIDL